MAQASLTKDRIVDAAFDLLSEGGLDAITARSLAMKLGVRAGALYYHLPDMAALRDEMGTRITARMLEQVMPTGDVSWSALLRRMAEGSRAVLLEYRDGARLVSGTYLTDDAALRSLEAPLAALVAAGFSPLDAQRALSTMNAFVVGFVIEHQHRQVAGPRYTAAERQSRLDPEQQPLSYAMSAEVVALPEDAFVWGVDALIAGIGSSLGRS